MKDDCSKVLSDGTRDRGKEGGESRSPGIITSAERSLNLDV